ncbi:hypothetical protein J6590_007378 [Homalodisca vitripennis]|nr:hypothetical protein J6590_007378 [Homalodisca vitripennis]
MLGNWPPVSSRSVVHLPDLQRPWSQDKFALESLTRVVKSSYVKQWSILAWDSSHAYVSARTRYAHVTLYTGLIACETDDTNKQYQVTTSVHQY